jgi:hypothetical protein
MKKSTVSLLLLSLGLLLFLGSILLGILATDGKNIIGGADLSTFFFVYFRENGGLYSTLGFCGFLSLVVGILLKLFSKISP